MRVVTPKLFELSEALVQQLRESRIGPADDPIVLELDAFLLDPGLGPTTYLTRDGRMLWDDGLDWNTKPTEANAYAAIVVGAKKTGVRGLLDLLPARTPDGVDCKDCGTSGWSDFGGRLKDTKDRPFSIVCTTCHGLGWTRLQS